MFVLNIDITINAANFFQTAILLIEQLKTPH